MARGNGAEEQLTRTGHGRAPGDSDNPVLWFVELAEAHERRDHNKCLRCQAQLWRLGWDVRPPTGKGDEDT